MMYVPRKGAWARYLAPGLLLFVACCGPVCREDADCPGGRACDTSSSTARCIEACQTNADCSGTNTCQLEAGYGQLSCAAQHSGPTADSACDLIIHSAVVPGSDAFGAPDPYLRITLIDQTVETEVAKGTYEPIWEQRFEDLRYGALAQMHLRVFDDDEGAILGGNDDRLGGISAFGGTWFMGEQHTRRFKVQNGSLTVQLSIECE